MIRILLSAANMGPDDSESDFDAWCAYVAAHIDEATGLVCEVDQAGYTGRTSIHADEISGATDEQRETIRGWLSIDGWEAWCASAEGA